MDKTILQCLETRKTIKTHKEVITIKQWSSAFKHMSESPVAVLKPPLDTTPRVSDLAGL